ncbi:MAG: hypothetical protein ABS44_02095 [Chryseobacterium sp. SCN 40-13]|nr:MAG: hypothetical protein ABS44_02095 [Chryseobacterium sp. SCN 40-13]
MIKEEMETKFAVIIVFALLLIFLIWGLRTKRNYLKSREGSPDDQGEIVELWIAIVFSILAIIFLLFFQ